MGTSDRHQVPIGLFVVFLWAVGTIIWVFRTGAEIHSSRILALPLVLLFPGYALVVALFPEKNSISSLERTVLSAFSSIFSVPLVGLAINFTARGIRPESYLFGLCVVTVFGTLLATVRLYRTPPGRRYALPVRWWADTVQNEVFPQSSRTALLNAIVAVSVIAAAISVGYAVTTQGGGGFTSTYLLTENENGEYVADDYPIEMTRGESEELAFGIENHEGTTVNYTVVVELQHVERSNETYNVVESQTITRVDLTLSPDESEIIDNEIEPQLTGDNVRLVYFVYLDEVPEDPEIGNAYQENHLWVNITETSLTVSLACPEGCR